MSTPRKRKSVATPATSSAKRRASAVKSKPEKIINLDGDDPFSFEDKADTHPEPLKNISMERTSFGGMKFSRSPQNTLSYSGLERKSVGESSKLVSTSNNTSATTEGKLSSQKTPVKGRRYANKDKELKFDVENADEESEANKTSEKPKPLITPSSSSEKRRKTANDSILAEKKKSDEELYFVPKLSPMEQLETDHPTETHQLLSPGARVLALWGHEFYAANVCGRDGLSRYFIHFVEDNLNRVLPPTGVIPLSHVTIDKEISFIHEVDDEEIGKVGKVIGIPTPENADEWAEGMFKVSVEDPDEEVSISWTKIFLTKEQRAKFKHKDVNTTIFVDKENIVSEARSSRRSRTTHNITPAKEVAATPAARKTPVKTPAANASAQKTPSTGRGGRSRVAAKVELTPIDSVSETAEEETHSNKSLDKAAFIKDDVDVGVDDAKNSDQPKPVGEDETLNSAEDETLPSETSDKTAIIRDGVDVAANEESNNSIQQENAEEEIALDKTQQQTPAKQESERSEAMDTEDIPTTKSPIVGEKSDSQELMDFTTNESAAVPEENRPTSPTKLNESSTISSTNEKSEQQPSLNGSGLMSTSYQPKSALRENTSGDLNNTDSESETGPSKVASAICADSPAKVAPPEPISFDTTMEKQLSTDVEASNKNFFENMKFVLTSASRNKKNTDFNKRDYRTKIEERGGEIIDDFSTLEDDEKAFLIADTFYRTHKYLSALSLSIPCVKHDWIQECVSQNQLLDFFPFMLPSGESSLEAGKTFEWKPLKNVLLKNKRVWVYSNVNNKSDERVLGFVDIWTSIIRNLGASLVENAPKSTMDKLGFCTENPVDILLSDSSCEPELAERVEAEGGIAVSSEWVIQAIVTGELPDVNVSQRFRFDSPI